MRSDHQSLIGLLAAILSATIVLGGFSLALSEDLTAVGPPTATPAPTDSLATLIEFMEVSPTRMPGLTPSATFPPPPTCPPPKGWQAYLIRVGDTLASLSETYGTTPDILGKANCLVGQGLLPGTILYVPPVTPAAILPTLSASIASAACTPPEGWILYLVKSHDTLFGISQAYGTTIEELQKANCLQGSTFLRTGMKIFVPNEPTRTPIADHTPSPPPTTPPSVTPTPAPLLTSLSNTSTPTITATITMTATLGIPAIPTDTLTAASMLISTP
jgi:LysM repeat protein